MEIRAAIDGQLTAEFAAYTKLVLANRIQSQKRGIRMDASMNSMSFEQFMQAIQKEQTVNHGYARQVSPDEAANNRVYMQYNGMNGFGHQRFATIQRAYELGLVDFSGILISSYQAEA
ncbi:hypothetical protein [Paenibacillus fonticola]|uniref:hypothetical protein n=1 Tax=Paenibacillus fonticola TaxID=379896 RepID=UPI000369EA63|nr:hypothetical protein [Paenibacillus fonticola]